MSPSKVMGYWPFWQEDKLVFHFCPEGFKRQMMRIWKAAKASLSCQALLTPNPKASLREQVREVMRFHHYSLRTEKAYWQWIRRYLAFHRRRDHSGPLKGWRTQSENRSRIARAWATSSAIALLRRLKMLFCLMRLSTPADG